MNLDTYQRAANLTARIHWNDQQRYHVPAFGLIGELGSLVSEIKKSLRDGEAYTDVRANLIEEFGDLLWYLAALASHYELTLQQLADSKMPTRTLTSNCGHVYSMVSAFASLVAALESIGAKEHARRKRKVSKALEGAVQTTLEAVKREKLKLDVVLKMNLRKVRSMFGTGYSHPAPCFDSKLPPFERLPRKVDIQFLERARGPGRIEVILRVNDLNIGDRLTDNASKDDGYRFHDAFHLAYAAVLGWSPVMRATFRCKRKSDASADEIEDGARAAIVEEAISQTVFNYARGHSMLKGLDRLDHGVLKLIQRMVRGLEVEKCELFEWQRAILLGYEAFRALRENRGGWLILDAETRTLNYTREGPGSG